ncbi:hypothetical protein [Massilia sp. BSC265]|uniref:hypothetical protein n=1 Tax=Massilia sp. BSC265 TaxID=1549812 RepID=UPI0004E8651E|nr:hypothetical protein [Massilia sp. BSC265]KFI07894.1 hypothetical protein JN27_07025 [Massilia sp. BSC265]
MKTFAKIALLFVFAVLLLDIAFDAADFMRFHLDGEEFDGPLGALLGVLFAGGGIVIAAIVTVVVGVVLAVVFAGVGVIVLGALGCAAVAVALALSPLLLPLLVPVAIVWYLVSRSRKAHVEQPMKPAQPAV